MSINACVFDFFNNVAFRHFTKRILVASEEKKDIRYVHLVCEDRGWILRKFAVRMQEELERKGYECSISNVTDSTADINHYIIYDSYEPIASYNDTIMITHIDSYNKLEMLKFQLGTANDFIDMIIAGKDERKVETMPYRQYMQRGFDGKVCERIASFIEDNLK